MTDNENTENVLERIVNALELSNDLTIQTLELQKTDTQALIAFTLMLNNVSMLGLDQSTQEEVIAKIRLNETTLNNFNLAEVSDRAMDRILGKTNIDIIKDLDPVDWEVGVNYTFGTEVKYLDKVYKVVQNHTSQENWTPDKAHTLFTLIASEKDIEDVGEGKCPDFVQPQANTTYNVDDCVVFEGKTYVSRINNNSWSPSAYPHGWELQSQ